MRIVRCHGLAVYGTRAEMHQDCAGAIRWRLNFAVLPVADTQMPQTPMAKLIFRNLRGICQRTVRAACRFARLTRAPQSNMGVSQIP